MISLDSHQVPLNLFFFVEVASSTPAFFLLDHLEFLAALNFYFTSPIRVKFCMSLILPWPIIKLAYFGSFPLPFVKWRDTQHHIGREHGPVLSWSLPNSFATWRPRALPCPTQFGVLIEYLEHCSQKAAWACMTLRLIFLPNRFECSAPGQWLGTVLYSIHASQLRIFQKGAQIWLKLLVASSASPKERKLWLTFCKIYSKNIIILKTIN